MNYKNLLLPAIGILICGVPAFGQELASVTKREVVEIKRDVVSAEQHNKRGLDYSNAMKYAEAIREFEAATELAPDFAEAQFNLGVIRLRESRAEDAVAPLKRAAQLNPRLAGAQKHLGVAYAMLGKQSDAANSLVAALAITPND